MSNIYFTSDTHFGHKNIASKNGSQWKGGYRHYTSLDEMNQDIVKSINQTVKPDDTLYHLGDWSFGGIENIWKLRKQIECQDIHLILGNHDHHIEEFSILPNCQYTDENTIVDGIPRKGFEVGASGLFSSVSHYKEVKINGMVYVLSHYGHRVWHGSHKGWIHLYGHSHDTLPSYGRSMDCGVDTAIRLLGKPRPFSVSEINDIMLKTPVEFPDHHELSTNTGRISGSRR